MVARCRRTRAQQQQQKRRALSQAAPPARQATPGEDDEQALDRSFAALGASVGAWLALEAPAGAAYTPAVAPEEATSIAQNAVGVLFTITFAAFMLRLLRKRATRATNVRLASERLKAPAAAPDQPVTAANCFLGAGMALVCALVLWTFTSFLEGAFDAQPVSDQYAVCNVTGTLRSILTGLSYLATFLFAANAVGLTGLGIQVASGGNASVSAAGAAPQDAAGQGQPPDSAPPE